MSWLLHFNAEITRIKADEIRNKKQVLSVRLLTCTTCTWCCTTAIAI